MNTEHMKSRGDLPSLPLRGASVVQCCIDYSVTLKFDSPSAQLRLEGSFTIRDESGHEILFPSEGDVTRFGPVLKLWGARVLEAIADENGSLTLRFDDGSELRAPPDPQYESWEFAGPSGFDVIAMPGGELAVWDAEADTEQ